MQHGTFGRLAVRSNESMGGGRRFVSSYLKLRFFTLRLRLIEATLICRAQSDNPVGGDEFLLGLCGKIFSCFSYKRTAIHTKRLTTGQDLAYKTVALSWSASQPAMKTAAKTIDVVWNVSLSLTLF